MAFVTANDIGFGCCLGTPVTTGATAGADAESHADPDAMLVVMLRFGGGS